MKQPVSRALFLLSIPSQQQNDYNTGGQEEDETGRTILVRCTVETEQLGMAQDDITKDNLCDLFSEASEDTFWKHQNFYGLFVELKKNQSNIAF